MELILSKKGAHITRMWEREREREGEGGREREREREREMEGWRRRRQAINTYIYIYIYIMLLNQLGSAHLCAVKPIYWHWAVVKESTAFITEHQARRVGSSCLKAPNSPMTFRDGVLKALWEKGLWGAWSVCAQFLEQLASRWSFKHHQPSGFSKSRVYVLAIL